MSGPFDNPPIPEEILKILNYKKGSIKTRENLYDGETIIILPNGTKLIIGFHYDILSQKFLTVDLGEEEIVYDQDSQELVKKFIIRNSLFKIYEYNLLSEKDKKLIQFLLLFFNRYTAIHKIDYYGNLSLNILNFYLL